MGDSEKGSGTCRGTDEVAVAIPAGARRAARTPAHSWRLTANPAVSATAWDSTVVEPGDSAAGAVTLERCLSRTSFDSLFTAGNDGDLRRSSGKPSLRWPKSALSLCGSSCLGSGQAASEDAAGAHEQDQQSPSLSYLHGGGSSLLDGEGKGCRRLLAVRKDSPSLQRLMQQVSGLDHAVDQQLRMIGDTCPVERAIAAAIASVAVDTGSDGSWRSLIVSWLFDLGTTLGLTPETVEYAFFIMQRAFVCGVESLRHISAADAGSGANSSICTGIIEDLAKCPLATVHLIGAAAIHMAAAHFGTCMEKLTDPLLEILSIDRNSLEYLESVFMQRFQWPKKPVGLGSYLVEICQYLDRRRRELRRTAFDKDPHDSTRVLDDRDGSQLEASLSFLKQSRATVTRIYLTMEATGTQTQAMWQELNYCPVNERDLCSMGLAKSSLPDHVDQHGVEFPDTSKNDVPDGCRSWLHPHHFCAALLLFIGQMLQYRDHNGRETPPASHTVDQDSCSVEQEHGSQGTGEQFPSVQPFSWPEIDDDIDHRSLCVPLNQLIAAFLPTDEPGLCQVQRCLAALQESGLRDISETVRYETSVHGHALSPHRYRERVDAAASGPLLTGPCQQDVLISRASMAGDNSSICRASETDSDEWLVRRFRRRRPSSHSSRELVRSLHASYVSLDRLDHETLGSFALEADRRVCDRLAVESTLDVSARGQNTEDFNRSKGISKRSRSL